MDIAVQGENLDVLALAYELTLATHLEVTVLDVTRAGYPLLNAIARDGIFVHQGRPGAARRWLSETRARLEAERPSFERMRDDYLRKLARGEPT